MSFADSQVYSSDTLAAGEETLAIQGVKLENMDDRESMEKELKDNLNQTHPRCHWKIIYHFVAHRLSMGLRGFEKELRESQI